MKRNVSPRKSITVKSTSRVSAREHVPSIPMWPTCTAGKQGSASWRSRTRQHKVSPHKNAAVTKTIAVFFLVSGKARPVSFCNRTVSRASFRDALAYISPYGAVAHFYILHYPPVLFSPHLSPPIFHSGSPVIFSAKFDCRLSALSSTACACRRKIFLPDTSASVFSASSLPGPATNPSGRKIISLRYRNVSEGKQKN